MVLQTGTALSTSVVDCLNTLSNRPGGLLCNSWFKIGAAGDGFWSLLLDMRRPVDEHCYRWTSRLILTVLKLFVQAQQRCAKHERARDALLAQVEAAAAASGRSRAEEAMLILAERVGLVAGTTLPRVELQPAGSEPLGMPVTRGATWSSAQPHQPATKQEQLDDKLGAGAFTVNEDGSLAGCDRWPKRHGKRRLGHAPPERQGECAAEGACSDVRGRAVTCLPVLWCL